MTQDNRYGVTVTVFDDHWREVNTPPVNVIFTADYDSFDSAYEEVCSVCGDLLNVNIGAAEAECVAIKGNLWKEAAEIVAEWLDSNGESLGYSVMFTILKRA